MSKKIEKFKEKVEKDYKKTFPDAKIEELEDEEEEEDFNKDIFKGMFENEAEHDAIDRGLDILFNDEDKRKISDIESNRVIDITALLTFNNYIDTPLIKSFCDDYLTLRLSTDRKSRAEIVDIYKTNILGDLAGTMPFEQEQPSLINRVRQKFRLG